MSLRLNSGFGLKALVWSLPFGPYELAYDEQQRQLSSREDLERKQRAQSLDGSYLLKSSRDDLSAEDIWRTYILLSRVESAFRTMKSPLCERPIFHHLQHRVDTHILLWVLAYHLLVCIDHVGSTLGESGPEITSNTACPHDCNSHKTPYHVACPAARAHGGLCFCPS
jgi:hypothetical protein